MNRKHLSTAVAGACIACSLGMPHAVMAQQESRASGGVLEEITVTARKREESLQEIPLSLSVFDSEALQAADIRDLEGVSTFTPGFQFVNQGNQQPGRYNTQLQFRGLTTAQFSPSFATGALFIDGQYVLNGGTSLSLMDIERVEVIKGPQAAYFGRNTFGGAVNLITRDPNMQEVAGELSLRSTNRSRNEVSGIIEVPLVEDVLAASLSGRFYDKRGHYYATDGGRTGDEETTAYNAVLKWNASENLEFKLRYAYSEDDDGAPAQGFVSGILNDSCTGRSIQTPEGTANPTRYICGQVPYGGAVQVDPGAGAISSNTFLPAFDELQQLTDAAALINGLPDVNDIGLRRETERLSLFGSYVFQNGYSLDVSYSDNEQAANSIRDFDNSDRLTFFSADPQRMEDQSWEIRLSSPQDGRLRWLVGYNYYEQEFISSGEGGNATTSCFATQQAPLLDNYPEGCIGGAPGVLNLFFPLGLANTDQAEVEGFFAAADFDITDTLTLSLEGRLQEDTLTKGAGLLNPGGPILEETFDDFLPRVILRWTPTDATNLWVSYSEGMIAGDFNATFINSDERERQQFLAIDPGLSESLDAETLDAWEVGLKQSLWQGRAQLNLAAFYYEWQNIKGRSSFPINQTCRPADIGSTGCDPELGIGVGDPKQILSNGELVPFSNAINVLLPGNATIQGIEGELWLSLSDTLSAQANVAWIDSEYDDYEFNFVVPVAGFAQMSGNRTPRQPEFSANASLTWDVELRGMPAYVRGDLLYQGEAYADESNLARIDDYTLLNARAGLTLQKLNIELFVTNLTNESAWMTGARWTDWGSPTQFPFLTAKQGVVVSPLDKRELGLRLNYRF